mgnify:CR=1 FL=1
MGEPAPNIPQILGAAKTLMYDPDSSVTTVQHFVQKYDEFKKIGDTCEQCGDDVYETIYEI